MQTIMQAMTMMTRRRRMKFITGRRGGAF